jgi:hypothetical protein
VRERAPARRRRYTAVPACGEKLATICDSHGFHRIVQVYLIHDRAITILKQGSLIPASGSNQATISRHIDATNGLRMLLQRAGLEKATSRDVKKPHPSIATTDGQKASYHP